MTVHAKRARHTMRARHTGQACAALVASAVLLAACSSSGSSAAKVGGTSAGVSAAPTNVVVGEGPVIVLATLFEAMDGDDFAANHLSARMQVTTSGAQAVPLLLNGQLQFAAADSVGALTAISKGIPIVIVAQGDTGPRNATADATGLQVLAGGPITSLKNLAGKTVAVNALGGLSQIATEAALDKAGVNPASVKFIELPIPQQNAAVKSGQVAAAMHSEPYLTEGDAEGLRTLDFPISAAIPGASQVVYIASLSYARAHPAAVREFVASMTTANTALHADPAQVRALAQTYAHVSAAVAAKILLPDFDATAPDPAGLALLNKVMVRYGVISKPVDIATAIYSG